MNTPSVTVYKNQKCITFGDKLLKHFGGYSKQQKVLKFLENQFQQKYNEIPMFPNGWEHHKNDNRVIIKFEEEEEKEDIIRHLSHLVEGVSLQFADLVEEME